MTRAIADDVLPLDPLASSPAIADGQVTPFTEEQARQYLDATSADGRPLSSVRKLAEEWGWHRSRVERFLARRKAENCQLAETPPGTAETPVETVAALVAKYTTTPKPDPDADFWERAREEGEIVAEMQDEVAIYRNVSDQIVIRRAANWEGRDDVVIVISPSNIPRLIAQLSKLQREAS